MAKLKIYISKIYCLWCKKYTKHKKLFNKQFIEALWFLLVALCVTVRKTDSEAKELVISSGLKNLSSKVPILSDILFSI